MAFCQVTAENNQGVYETVLIDYVKFVFYQEY